MAVVLGTSEAARLIHAGSASTGQAKPERKTSGSEVKRTTCMAVSRLVKKARTAKPRKIVARRKGTVNRATGPIDPGT